MNLGIARLLEQLNDLASTGVYLITAPDQRTAVNFAVHCLRNNRDEDLLKFLALEHVTRDDIVREISAPEALSEVKAHVYTSRGRRNFLSTLVNDYRLSSRNRKGALLTAVFADETLATAGEREYERLLRDLDRSARRAKLCVLLVCFGPSQSLVGSRAMRISEVFQGVGAFELNLGRIIFHSRAWRQSDGTISHGTVQLTLDAQGYAVAEGEHVEHLAGDRDVCYVTAGSFTPDQSMFARILTFASNAQLFEQASQEATLATLCLSVSRRDEIFEIARIIYELRIARGDGLRIFVVEKIQGMRGNSAQLLLACGADFIFEASAHNSYINSMLPVLRMNASNHNLSATFDEMIFGYRLGDQEENGFLRPEIFLGKVEQLLERSETFDLGSTLVSLTPGASYSAEACISQFKPKRGGDYCTYVNGRILVYLPTCQAGELTTGLRHTFNVEPTDLFSGSSAFYTRAEILNVIRELRAGTYDESLNAGVIDQIESENRARTELRFARMSLRELANVHADAAVPYDVGRLKARAGENFAR